MFLYIWQHSKARIRALPSLSKCLYKHVDEIFNKHVDILEKHVEKHGRKYVEVYKKNVDMQRIDMHKKHVDKHYRVLDYEYTPWVSVFNFPVVFEPLGVCV